MDWWVDVHCEFGSEIDSVPISAIIPPNIFVRIEILENLIEPSSILFPAISTANENAETLCEMQSIGKQIGE